MMDVKEEETKEKTKQMGKIRKQILSNLNSKTHFSCFHPFLFLPPYSRKGQRVWGQVKKIEENRKGLVEKN